jgi:hypothetical protein
MTIVTVCTLVLNAVVAVLLVGYGIWFRNVVAQQLATKDTTIETLDAVVKLHEAELSALKREAAPAIANEHKTMREFAEQMAAEKQKLEEQVKALNAALNAASGRDKSRTDQVLGESHGLILALGILHKHVSSLHGMSAHAFVVNTSEAFKEISTEIQNRQSTAMKLLSTS